MTRMRCREGSSASALISEWRWCADLLPSAAAQVCASSTMTSSGQARMNSSR